MPSFNGWNLVTLPTDPPAPKSIEWELNDVQGMNRSPFSLGRQIYDWQQSQLKASVSYPVMTQAQANNWIVFLMALRGVAGAFSIGDPLNLGPQNPGATAGAVSGSGQTGYTLATSSTGLLPGDWIQLGLRLYKVISVSGGTLGIWPPLRESPAGGTSLIIHNTQGLFCLSKNSRKYSVGVNKLYAITFEIEEAL